jgi:hypothetical protein
VAGRADPVATIEIALPEPQPVALPMPTTSSWPPVLAVPISRPAAEEAA